MKASLTLLLTLSMQAWAADWIVIPLENDSSNGFVEATLPNGTTASGVSHGGVLDTKQSSVKWGPLAPDTQALTFLLENATSGQAIGIASAPEALTTADELTLPKDEDNDGLSEALENQLGLSDNDPDDAKGDLDQDGRSNLTETLAGTDPADSQSYAEVASATYDRSTGTLKLSLPEDMDTSTMILESATNLAAPVWERLTNWQFSAQNEGMKTLEVPVAPEDSPARYFRLRWGR